MDDGLKQRIIGAFVLLAIAVIFVPVLFDKERIEPVDRKTQIPPAPYIEPIVIEYPVAPEPLGKVQNPEEMFVPDEKTLQNLDPVKPSLDEKGLPQSWVLQLASFKSNDHATKFRDKLIADGYAAFIREINTKHGKMTRVYVGPKLDKSRLLKEKEKIEKVHKLTAIVLKFEP